MGDDGDDKSDPRWSAVAGRIAASFPKLAGAKLDKVLGAEEVKEVIQRFLDDETCRCLVVPDSLKVDTVIPSKIGKGKVLLFVRLTDGPLNKDDVGSQVSTRSVKSHRHSFLAGAKSNSVLF
jgi:hypothetical protein